MNRLLVAFRPRPNIQIKKQIVPNGLCNVYFKLHPRNKVCIDAIKNMAYISRLSSSPYLDSRICLHVFSGHISECNDNMFQQSNDIN